MRSQVTCVFLILLLQSRTVLAQPFLADAWGSSLRGRYSNNRCPAWLSQYVRFHRATKGTPAARYLAYICSGGGQDCYFGLGDRLRGIELMLRAAVASKRVLLVDIPHPIPFTSFFKPARIDWTMGKILIPANATWYMRNQSKELLRSNVALHEPNPFVAVEGHNLVHVMSMEGAPEIGWVGSAAHCLFRALFQPTPRVEKAVSILRRQLGIFPPISYLAIHLRLGGLHGEAGPVYRYDPLEALHHSLRCAKKLAASRGSIHNIFVVITDSMELKNLIHSGFLSNTSTSRIIPVFSAVDGTVSGSKGKMPLIRDQISTVADMGVMAGAECLIADFGSGFSTHARLWGAQSLWSDTNPCYLDTLTCIKEGGGGVGMEDARL